MRADSTKSESVFSGMGINAEVDTTAWGSPYTIGSIGAAEFTPQPKALEMMIVQRRGALGAFGPVLTIYFSIPLKLHTIQP